MNIPISVVARTTALLIQAVGMARIAPVDERPSQPAPQPSKQPAQPSPQPAQPATPPSTSPPGNQPVNPSQPNNPSQPANPAPQTQPPPVNQPPQSTAPPTLDPTNPNAPARPDGVGVQERSRFVRPFPFQSPQAEGAFNQSARRLVQMERKMERTNAELLRRLGEARQLTGERQSAAVLDVLQQVLLSQKEWQTYMTQSRTMFTGELEAGEDEAVTDGTTGATGIANPAARQPSNVVGGDNTQVPRTNTPQAPRSPR